MSDLEIRWARSRYGKWHGFAVFEGYTTAGAMCSSMMKMPDVTLPKPITDGLQDVCRDCTFAAQAMRKRYRRGA